jgi:hypothetical protein
METGRSRHPLDGVDAAALALQSEIEAGEDGPAVDGNGARPALAELASVLGSREPQVFAQNLEERLVRRERDLDRLAVECEADVRFRAIKSGRLAHSQKSMPFVLRWKGTLS